MGYNKLSISEAMEKIVHNRYVLPSIQREFVWKPEQIEELFDSLMQDYPIGTFLFWEIDKDSISKFTFYEFLRNYHERDAKHNQRIDLKGSSDGIIAVLDGQQRLTSLYIGLKGSYADKLKHKKRSNDDAYPARKLYCNLVSEATDGKKTYDFRFLAPSDVKNDENSYWFEVGKILDMNNSATMKYVNNNISKSDSVYTDAQSEFAMDLLGKLCYMINGTEAINFYLYKSAKPDKSDELDKVLDIFVRINSSGTQLSSSDLLLSVVESEWKSHNARDEITALVDDINRIGKGFKFNKDFVMKSMLVLADLPVAFKVKNFNKENINRIGCLWDDIQRAIKQAVRLVSSFGYSGESLSSTNAVIPIAYYLFKIGLPANFAYASDYASDRKNIKKWLISVLLKKQFSGHPDNVLRSTREILKTHSDSFPLDEIIEHFKGSDKSIKFTEDDIDEYLLKLTYENSETLSTLMLLYPTLDFSNIFHMDHMYPKSKFTKKHLSEIGIPSEAIPEYINAVNDISNLQLLSGDENIIKSDKDFDKWFDEEYPSDEEKEEQRVRHYMPNMEYSYENFTEFINQRRELMKKKLKELLK